MSRITLIAAFVLVGMSVTVPSARAAEKLPPEITAGEHRLLLNGSGVRTKAFLELYTAGLYLSKASNDPRAIIAAEEPMAIRIRITSGFVSQSSLVESLEEGFKSATGGDTREIRTEIDQFRLFFMDGIKKGDIFDMVYIPQHGVIVNKNGKHKGVVPNAKFKQALFSIWLSDKPADNSLKQALLKSSTSR